VTRQMVSVPATAEEHLSQADGDGVRLLGVTRHGNKLRPGHLRGNRFRVLVRDVAADAHPRLDALLARIRAHGLPNFYGPQRFGKGGETLGLGLALLRREPPPVSESGRIPNLRNRFLRKLALSAVQSMLFNQCLGARLADGLFRRVISGDVMTKYPKGG